MLRVTQLLLIQSDEIVAPLVRRRGEQARSRVGGVTHCGDGFIIRREFIQLTGE